MNNIIQDIEKSQIEGKSVPDFRSGDTVKVSVKVKEGSRERIQVFEGIVIAKKSDKAFNSSFTVRKISNGEGVERTFNTYSPSVSDIAVVRYGLVRRAKLYFLRGLTGRKARIKEKVKKKA
jgi:large subunit ribosomal protein L19